MTFLNEHVGEIIVLALSIILSVATEKWFPTTDPAQKHFWSAMLFIFSIVLGFSVKSDFEMNNNMQLLSSQLKEHARKTESEAGIHEVAHLYEQLIGGATHTLRQWGLESQHALENDLKAGYIPLDRENAPTTISAAYRDARNS